MRYEDIKEWINVKDYSELTRTAENRNYRRHLAGLPCCIRRRRRRRRRIIIVVFLFLTLDRRWVVASSMASDPSQPSQRLAENPMFIVMCSTQHLLG